jgi:hypothetical protein
MLRKRAPLKLFGKNAWLISWAIENATRPSGRLRLYIDSLGEGRHENGVALLFALAVDIHRYDGNAHDGREDREAL